MIEDGAILRSCDRVQKVCSGGRTQQHFKDQCDINTIVEKARISGFVSHVNSKQGQYLDVSAVPDYKSALAVVTVARDNFMALPSGVRERFGNDPAQMIKFMSDKANYDEAVKLGLFVKPEPEKVQMVHVVGSDVMPSGDKPT